MSDEKLTPAERFAVRKRRALDEVIVALAAFGGRISLFAPRLRDSTGGGDRVFIAVANRELVRLEAQSAELRDVLDALALNTDPPPMPLNEAAMKAEAEKKP